MSTGPKLDKATAPAPTPAPGSADGPQKLLLAGALVVVALLGILIWVIASGRGLSWGDGNSANTASAAGPQMPNRGRLLPSGVRIETIREGTGPLVQATDTVLLRYELRILGRDGIVEGNFSDPQPIPMSPGGTVPGFAEALTTMRAGGEARFWVPPALGYGGQTRPGSPIGPNDILEFRVRVERIGPPTPTPPPGAGGNELDAAALNAAIEAAAAPPGNAAEPAGRPRGR